MARNPLQIGDDSGNPLGLAPWQIGDPTDPMAVADARNTVAGVDALTAWLAEQRAKTVARAPIWNPNNPVGTETTRPQQSVGMPDPSFRPGVFAGGGTVPMSQEQIDAFRRGSEGVYDQASLLAGVTPVAGGARAVSLGARRPLANPPPSRAPEPVVEQPSFTIYHGSPHLFAPTERNPLGEFDPTKIGTGEGEQAYGVGAGYGAENEGVARGYRKKLSGPAPGFTGEIAPELRAALKAEDYLGFDRPADAISAMETHPDWRQRWDVENPDALAAHFDAHQEAKYGGQGHMYEVNVNADPERFLHWDKPLSEQHPDVQSLLPKLPDGVTKLPTGRWATTLQGEVIGRPDGWPDMSTAQYVSQTMRQDLGDTSKWTGSDLHRHLVRQNPGNPAAPSEIMSQAGIPGIRYLDQGSRGAGEGSHNYVVFDANTMNIIRRYGLAGLMAGGGAAAAQQRQPNALQQQ